MNTDQHRFLFKEETHQVIRMTGLRVRLIRNYNGAKRDWQRLAQLTNI